MMTMASTWGRWIGRAIAVAVVLALCAVAAWAFATSWRPAIDVYPLQGVDVSAAQGEVDWQTVRSSGADFVYLRATEGADIRDARFASHWRQVYDAGMRRGAIHLFSFCRTALDQANNFVVTVPRTADALPAAVDLDFDEKCDSHPDRAVLIDELTRFLKVTETHTGKPMLIRVSEAVEREYGLSSALTRPVWTAANFFPPEYTARPWRMWRASDIRRIDGVEGPINWNVVAP
jgi:lysozyme